MRTNILNIIIFMLCTFSASAQTIVPEKSAGISQKQRTLYQRAVSNINSMPLRCDTLHYKPFEEYRPLSLLETAYFDTSGQLRKYLWKDACYDGAHDNLAILAYYDKKGELIYMNVTSGSHCTDTEESYYFHNGCVTDFKVVFDCGCCDGEDMFTKEEMDKIRPAIGSILTVTAGANLSLVNFMHTATLFTLINSKDYNGNGWATLSSFDRNTNSDQYKLSNR